MADDKQVLISAELDTCFDPLENNHPYNQPSTSIIDDDASHNGGFSESTRVNLNGCQKNNLIISVRKSIQSKLIKASSSSKKVVQAYQFHWKAVLTAFFTVISTTGCLIFFPLHLESLTHNHTSDSYSACFSIVTLVTVMLFLVALALKFFYRTDEKFIKPQISWQSILKIGFSVGISVLTLFYSWEDHKVLCNFQDPLLGLVVIFAIITHAVSKWRRMGLKRIFALTTIAAGVFVSVDYPLVDQHRCRGYYYHILPNDPWTWKVHVVWTLAFVVSIWLWTVAMFFVETSVPVPKIRHKRLQEGEYNAVKMTVIRVVKSNQYETRSVDDPDIFACDSTKPKTYLYSPYAHICYVTVINVVLWFSISTWIFIASLFWTEFIPGFGRGVDITEFPVILLEGFYKSYTNACSWLLVISVFIFAQSFTYFLLLVRSPMIAIAVTCVAFPTVGLWWSFFQIKYNFFVWMPVLSGELICSFLSFPLIMIGTYFMLKYDVLNPTKLSPTVTTIHV